jgi:hypothetical protein
VVFVDALGPAQLARLAERPGALPHRTHLDGVLGYSSGALPTVLTGATPARHGRMCLFTQRASDAEPVLRPLAWLGLLPRILHERPRVRGLVGRWLAEARRLEGYVNLGRVPPEAFRWLDLPEREDLFAARDIGGSPTFLQDARDAGLTVEAARWQLPEAARWGEIFGRIEARPPDLAFLYATELDGLLHAQGNRGPDVDAALDRLAARILRARTAMTRGGAQVRTLVVGDHGMADVERVVDPRTVLRHLDTRSFVDSTMLRVWGDARQLERARRVLERSGVPGAYLDADELRSRDVPVDAGHADGLWLLPEGTLFAPSYMGGVVRGMHGYELGSASSRAGLMTDDVGLAASACGLTDVARAVRSWLGLPSTTA